VGAPAAADDLGDLHAALQVDAVAAVQAGEDRGHLAAQDSQQRQLNGLEDGDRCAGPPGGGRDLQADPAGPDHDHAGLGVEDDPDPVAVLDGAQVVHAVQIGAGGRESPRRGAGGQQELGVADPAAIGQGHLVGGGVDCGGGDTEAQVDVVVGVPPFGMDEDGVPASAALQVFLRQGRPFVGPVRLGPEEHDRPLEALLPQRRSGSGAGQAGPDDDVCGVGGHAGLPCWSDGVGVCGASGAWPR